MFIPISTDIPHRRRPIVNETIVLLNVLVYIAGLLTFNRDWLDRDSIANAGAFLMADFKPWTLITYQFIHDPGGIGHILFNMVFLWVFGNAVESRLGRAGYAAFYLTAGCVAALLHGLLNPHSPVIGASGSIAGVTGAFLCLFPRSRVRVIYFFFLIGVIVIPAAWMILLYFVIDLVNQFLEFLGRSGGVAYAAHLGGSLFGFTSCLLLLAFGVVKRQDTDVLSLLKQMRRRAEFRAVTRSAPGVWDQPKHDASLKRTSVSADAPLSPDQQATAEQRAEINRLLAAHDLQAGAEKYRALTRAWPAAVLPESRQLDVANWFYQQGDTRTAARAYERLLETYPLSRHADQVRLMLAVIYIRRERDSSRARVLLDLIRPKLTGQEASLADELASELGGAA